VIQDVHRVEVAGRERVRLALRDISRDDVLAGPALERSCNAASRCARTAACRAGPDEQLLVVLRLDRLAGARMLPHAQQRLAALRLRLRHPHHLRRNLDRPAARLARHRLDLTQRALHRLRRRLDLPDRAAHEDPRRTPGCRTR
jgi:hypothetical protein